MGKEIHNADILMSDHSRLNIMYTGRGRGRGYQPKPKAEADNPYLYLDYSGYHKNLIQ